MKALLLAHPLLLVCLYGGGIAAAPPMPRSASGFPVRPITLMAPANPGGGWDQLARLVQLVLIEEDILPVSLQVVNRGGAGGTIGLAELVGRNRNEEHTIMIAGSVMVGAVVAHHSPFGLRDTTPIARLTSEYLVVAVPPDSSYQTIGDLMTAFASAPGAITWGGGSAGGSDHEVVALLGRAAGVSLASIRYVAFAGGGEAATAVMGSQLSALVTGYGEIQHLAKSGKVRLLATTAPGRMSPDAPPALVDAGIDVVMSNWRGIVAPPGMSAEASAWFVEALRRMRGTDAWQEILERNEWEDSFLVGEDFRVFIEEERTRTEAILAELGFGSGGGAGYATVGPWTFPTVIGVAFVVSAVFAFRRPKADVSESSDRLDEQEKSPPVAWSRAMLMIGALACFPWVMSVLGFHISAVALLLGVAGLFGGGRPAKVLVFAVALTTVSFVIFDTLLGVNLPVGPLGGWFQ